MDLRRRRAVALVMVGDELLDGRTRETNSHYLIDRLGRFGGTVGAIHVVGDEEEEIVAALAAAHARHAAVVVTGGLGPTEDDRTRQALAAFVGEDLVEDPALREGLERRYRERGRSMARANLRQALRTPSGRPIANPRGTAPGLLHLHEGIPLLLLPGVPAELRAMWEATGEGVVRPLVEASAPVVLRLRTSRLPESEAADRVEEAGLDRTAVEVAYCVTRFGVDLLLRARRSDADLEAAARPLLESLHPAVYGVGPAGLDAVVTDALRRRRESIAVAESCTGGLLGAALTEIPGSSAWFRGGVLAYADAVKESLLGVPGGILRAQGAVAEETARAMAREARRRLGTDWALSITGIAGPEGGTAIKPVGTVWVGLSGPDGERAELSRFPGDRRQNRIWSVSAALDLLRRSLGLHAVREGG